jgi:hypothetical protein
MSSAVEYVLGMNAKIYIGETGDEVADMSVMDNCSDVTLSMDRGEADITTRANQGWRSMVGTLRECSVEFKQIWKPGDANFESIKDAFLNSTTVELAVLDGDKDTVGSQGPKGSFSITGFKRNEPLEEAITIDVTAKLCTYDDWYVAEDES